MRGRPHACMHARVHGPPSQCPTCSCASLMSWLTTPALLLRLCIRKILFKYACAKHNQRVSPHAPSQHALPVADGVHARVRACRHKVKPEVAGNGWAMSHVSTPRMHDPHDPPSLHLMLPAAQVPSVGTSGTATQPHTPCHWRHGVHAAQRGPAWYDAHACHAMPCAGGPCLVPGSCAASP